MTGLYAGTKGAWQMTSKKASMEKREEKATDGDGEVTMKTLKEKNVKEQKMFACKRAYGCKTWYGMHTPGNSPVKSGDRPR